jgi:hypothetical protein
MRLCMERIAPVGANRPVAIELPAVNTPEDVAAAARAVMAALCQGAISAREAINLLTVVERLARLAERVQQMKERHPVWQGGGSARPEPSLEAFAKEAARTALAAALKEEGIEDPGLYSPVNSEPEPAETEPSGSPAADATAGERLYSPVNPAIEAAVRPQSAQATGSILERRRRALMESASPAALLLGAQPIDPRSYVTEQKWLAELLETGRHGATKRNAA